MLPTTSPFRQNHDVSCRLGALRTVAAERERCRLYGTRKVRFPLMALMTSQELGAVRHALSQRVVAGTLQISYPFRPKPVPKTSKT